MYISNIITACTFNQISVLLLAWIPIYSTTPAIWMFYFEGLWLLQLLPCLRPSFLPHLAAPADSVKSVLWLLFWNK